MKAISAILFLVSSVAFADDFRVFPEAVLKKIAKSATVTGAKQAICNGNKAKVNPKVEVTVRYPDTQGMVIDDARKIKQTFMQNIRDYLKYYYFMGVSGDVEKGDEYKAYVQAFSEPEYAHDLGLLRAGYTFKFPKDVIENVFKGYGDLNKQLFAWDYYEGTWSARIGLENRDWIWKKFLASQTKVKEAPAGDKAVRFHLELDMAMFCAYGISGLDLISR